MEKTLARIDLNLLRALNVLLEERNVTRAAERLFITQSAMSKSLHRLRELLDDPLFVRSSHGLLPTTRAIELTEPLHRIFEQVDHCLQPSRFDPAEAHGRVRIATPEQFALATIPKLLMRLQDAAPNLSLESQHLMDDHLERLAANSLDFVVNLEQPYPDDYCTRRIYSALPTLWFRKNHPLATKPKIKLADISAYPHITFRSLNLTPNLIGTIDNIFLKARLGRKVILDTSHLMIALDVLIGTDALILAPDYLSRVSMLHAVISSRPLNNIRAFDHLHLKLSLVQHQRTLRSPLHQWVSEEIANALSSTDTAKTR